MKVVKFYYSAKNSAGKNCSKVHAFQTSSHSRCPPTTSFCSNFVM